MADSDRFTDWLTAAGGEMGARIAAFDWSRTPVGPIASWSAALRTMVRFLLANRFPLLLWWGPDYISIYNDAYRPVLGTKHPRALGQPLRECWDEIWHILQPLVDTPFNGGPATWDEDILLEIDRHGFREETHFTVAYSAVPDETAPTGIGGVLATVHEITEKVVGERRLNALRDLAAATAEAKTADDAGRIAAQALVGYPRDIPFAVMYLNSPDGRQATLAGCAGTEPSERFCPKVIDLDPDAARGPTWPLGEGADAKTGLIVDDLTARFGGDLPAGPWSDPPRQALILPIQTGLAQQAAGFLVAGISARLKLDDAYRSFCELLANQTGIAITNARAYDDERRRAEALAELDRAKTAFFSNVSHEFRTPLTLMLGPIEDTLAGSDALPAVDRERLQAAQRNSLRLLKLVNSLLDFSRIEAGRIEASYEATDLARFTAELASVFRSTMERARITFTVDCPPLPQQVYVDREMWEKIVFNLISNAFKFTFAGHVEVALRQVGENIELTVSDSGTGIPAEEISHLFERFHRVKGAQGRSYEGSGIGLALVHELVKLHAGTVRAESELDRGSRFIVTLPLGTAHLPADRIAAPRNLASTGMRAGAIVEEMSQWLRQADQTEKSAGSDLLSQELVADVTSPDDSAAERVLLADDNADMRHYVERLLTQSGYRVTVVADGLAAIAAARDHRPDLVVSDVMMPRLDGFGLLREFRADARLATVPVILLSARAGEEARIEGMQAGATDYLVKPFGARELVARVQASLRLARMRDEAAAAVRKSEERFRALVTATSYVTYRMNADWTEMLELHGRGVVVDSPLPSATWLKTYIHPDDQARVTAAVKQAVAAKGLFELEHRMRRIDGTLGWTLSRAVPLLDSDGEIVEWFGAATDITDRRKAENTRQLLLGELNHRVKNTLASVQAIAAQTLRYSKEPSEFAARFSGRIQSLSRVHSLLTDMTWHGADLNDVINDQLLQGTAEKTRLAVSGPAVHLDPQTAVLLALMLHELGTNSAKYGALSSADGQVTLNWSALDDTLNLQWIERGGPRVTRPTRLGFGTMLIEQSVKSAGGSAEMLCEEGGITWKLAIKLPHVEAQKPDATPLRPERPAPKAEPRAPRGTKSAPLDGLRILVIEDEPLIALELVATLEGAGADAAGSVGAEAAALATVQHDDFDCVLLDANLHGHSVNAIAAALTRRRIPFIFISGYGRDNLPISFRHTVALEKPVNDKHLIAAILKLVSPARNVATLKPQAPAAKS